MLNKLNLLIALALVSSAIVACRGASEDAAATEGAARIAPQFAGVELPKLSNAVERLDDRRALVLVVSRAEIASFRRDERGEVSATTTLATLTEGELADTAALAQAVQAELEALRASPGFSLDVALAIDVQQPASTVSRLFEVLRTAELDSAILVVDHQPLAGVSVMLQPNEHAERDALLADLRADGSLEVKGHAMPEARFESFIESRDGALVYLRPHAKATYGELLPWLVRLVNRRGWVLPVIDLPAPREG